MGIAPSVAAFITSCCVALDRAGQNAGRCLTLGKQGIHVSEAQLYHILANHGLVEVDAGKAATIPQWMGAARARLEEQDKILATIPGRRGLGEISDSMFFECLGFTDVHSVDASDYEGADFVHDLNQPGLAEVVDGPYDLVIDVGTMEHVFNVPGVLRNIFDVLKIGGSIIHVVPANNLVDHGFYQFSPVLFYQYYLENSYRLIACYFTEESATGIFGEPISFHEYPGTSDLSQEILKGSDTATYGTAFCAQKTEATTWDTIPQQSSYTEKWDSQ